MLDGARSWIRDHPRRAVGGAVAVLLCGILVLAFVATVFGGPSPGDTSEQAAYDRLTSGDRAVTDASRLVDDAGGSSYTGPEEHDETGAGAYVEVQEARFDIDSDDVRRDEAAIESLADQHAGYVEESRTRESTMYRTVDMTVRVPDAEFGAFTDMIRDRHEVESFNVQNYRVQTQRELDELRILNNTLAEYERVRQRIEDMNTSEEKINLLMTLTEKELAVKEKQRHYEQQLEDKQRRGEEATVHITLRERKNVDVWPENLKNRFMRNVQEMIDDVVNILLGTVTQAVVLFFRAIQALIYLAVIAVPLIIVYCIGRRVYDRRETS